MAKGLTEYLLKFILGVILVALAFFAMKKAYNEASTKIMEYLGFGNSRYVKLYPDSKEELKLKEIKNEDEYGAINEQFMVEIPSGSKYTFIIESFNYDGSVVKYSLEYSRVDNENGFISRDVSDSEYLNINTPDGCLKLKISGINCREIHKEGTFYCSGTVKVELELTSSSC